MCCRSQHRRALLVRSSEQGAGGLPSGFANWNDVKRRICDRIMFVQNQCDSGIQDKIKCRKRSCLKRNPAIFWPNEIFYCGRKRRDSDSGPLLFSFLFWEECSLNNFCNFSEHVYDDSLVELIPPSFLLENTGWLWPEVGLLWQLYANAEFGTVRVLSRTGGLNKMWGLSRPFLLEPSGKFPPTHTPLAASTDPESCGIDGCKAMKSHIFWLLILVLLPASIRLWLKILPGY